MSLKPLSQTEIDQLTAIIDAVARSPLQMRQLVQAQLSSTSSATLEACIKELQAAFERVLARPKHHSDHGLLAAAVDELMKSDHDPALLSGRILGRHVDAITEAG